MKENKNLYYQSATALVSALANKEISSVELVQKMIARIEQLDKKINAVVVRDFERALIAAKAADQALASGERLPLLGLPITVKESFNVAGLPTTWGNPIYKNWCPTEDALAIARLKKAGAIIMGKTNVAHMLQDWQTYNPIYGTTNNPWNFHLTPGGSSGGSAAALAAGFTALELGSDFAGSIRVPSHFCGIFGHKPSVNLVPMRGASPPTTPPSPNPIDLIVGGPMARTAADLALALQVIAGPDELWDGKGYQLALPASRYDEIHRYRVLILSAHPLCPTSRVMTKSIMNLGQRLTQLGVNVSYDTKKLPDLAKITQTYLTLFCAFLSGNVPIETYHQWEAMVKELAADDQSINAYILRGCIATHRDWSIANRVRGQLRQQWRNLYREFDVIICPIMPTAAFAHDHSEPEQRQIEIDGMKYPYHVQFAWPSIATFFGLPATVAPIDRTEKGLPLGVQIIGDYLEDYTTIKFADLLERKFGGFEPNFNMG